MEGIKNWWNGFVEKHPALAKWIREGGLFVVVSNLITVFKYIILTFLPLAFASLGSQAFGWPNIELTIGGKTFPWMVIGYGAEQGGLAYFTAYMVAMVIGEVINFPIQKFVVFQNKDLGKTLAKQIIWYIIAFCVITVIVNSINCIWVAVAQDVWGVPNWLYNIVTVVMNGGVSMVIFFFVNKIIFPETKKN